MGLYADFGHRHTRLRRAGCRRTKRCEPECCSGALGCRPCCRPCASIRNRGCFSRAARAVAARRLRCARNVWRCFARGCARLCVGLVHTSERSAPAVRSGDRHPYKSAELSERSFVHVVGFSEQRSRCCIRGCSPGGLEKRCQLAFRIRTTTLELSVQGAPSRSRLGFDCAAKRGRSVVACGPARGGSTCPQTVVGRACGRRLRMRARSCACRQKHNWWRRRSSGLGTLASGPGRMAPFGGRAQ
mmetsp:Transcript_600/g.2529  ORF Transcript_600/g.2529 Transcript_600/m.2529 type:complete len:244 (-) Transcript_600:3613-4344(-)